MSTLKNSFMKQTKLLWIYSGTLIAIFIGFYFIPKDLGYLMLFVYIPLLYIFPLFIPIILAYRVPKNRKINTRQSILLSLFSGIIMFLIYLIPCLQTLFLNGFAEWKYVYLYTIIPALIFSVIFFLSLSIIKIYRTNHA